MPKYDALSESPVSGWRVGAWGGGFRVLKYWGGGGAGTLRFQNLHDPNLLHPKLLNLHVGDSGLLLQGSWSWSFPFRGLKYFKGPWRLEWSFGVYRLSDKKELQGLILVMRLMISTPALPIIRNIYHSSHSLGSLK